MSADAGAAVPHDLPNGALLRTRGPSRSCRAAWLARITKLSDDDVLQVRALYDHGALTCRQIGELFAISDGHVSMIGRRRQRRAVPEAAA